MKLIPAGAITACLISSFAFTSCNTYTGTGAAAGAGAGALAGAVFGKKNKDVLRAAAIGTAIGAGAGALADASVRNQGYNASNTRYNDGYQSPPPQQNQNTYQTPQTSSQYPAARATQIPTQVVSPYRPYNVIDISGFQRGELAVDPTNNKPFRIP